MSFSLRDYLKEGTRDLHQATEKSSLLSDLLLPEFTKESYQKILGLLYQVHWVLEQKLLSVERLEEFVPDLENRMKTRSLEADLGTPGTLELLEVPFSNLSLSEAFGILYVLEGSTLGGQMIQKKLRQNPALKDSKFNYYGHYGSEVVLYWQRFIGFLEKASTDQKIHPFEVLAASRKVFEMMGRQFERPTLKSKDFFQGSGSAL